MANIKISQMPGATGLTGSELIPIVQNGTNKTTTVSKLTKDFVTEEYVDNAISNFSNTIVCASLPEEGQPNKIYLVPGAVTADEGADTDNSSLYDEYLWTEHDTWEFLGNKTVDIDLSNYYNIDQLNSIFAKKTDLQGTYEHPEGSGYRHIPAGGTLGQILINTGDGNCAWQYAQNADQTTGHDLTGLEDIYSYGIQWDIYAYDGTVERIGNPELHKTLPVQSQFKGCHCNKGVIKKYFRADNWNYYEDGTATDLTTNSGMDVRVHTPQFWGKSGMDGSKCWVRISAVKIDDTWLEIPEMVTDAYGVMQYLNTYGNGKYYKGGNWSVVDEDLTKAFSTTADGTTYSFNINFRGGSRNVNTNYDKYSTKARRMANKPSTGMDLADRQWIAHTYGSQIMEYEWYKWLLYWCPCIEFGTLKPSQDVNTELTEEGYHQGGYGSINYEFTSDNGSEIDYWNTYWDEFNEGQPIIPKGLTNACGNNTGTADMYIPSWTTSDGTVVPEHTFTVSRYRGFENVSGECSTLVTGIMGKISDDDDSVVSIYSWSSYKNHPRYDSGSSIPDCLKRDYWSVPDDAKEDIQEMEQYLRYAAYHIGDVTITGQWIYKNNPNCSSLSEGLGDIIIGDNVRDSSTTAYGAYIRKDIRYLNILLGNMAWDSKRCMLIRSIRPWYTHYGAISRTFNYVGDSTYRP